MANIDAPFGLRPVRHYGGGLVRANEYQIASGYASNIFSGSPVKSVGTNKRIQLGTAGDTLVGVFGGVQMVDATGDIKYLQHWPANQTLKAGSIAKALVYDDPLILFEIQASGAFAAADIGQMANLTAESGDVTTGRSTVEIDSATIAQANDIQVKIIELAPKDDNNFGANAIAHVLINEHEMRAAMTAV